MRHVLDLCEFTADELERIFVVSEDLKAKFKRGVREPLLPGRVTMALLFEKLLAADPRELRGWHDPIWAATSMFLGEDVGFGNNRESRSPTSAACSASLSMLSWCRAPSQHIRRSD